MKEQTNQNDFFDLSVLLFFILDKILMPIELRKVMQIRNPVKDS